MTRARHLAAMGRCRWIASATTLSAPVLLVLLAGCTSNPIVPAGNDIQSFSASLSGRTLKLNPGGTGFNKAESSGWERDYGYLGLKEELASASTHCQTAGGVLRLAEHKPVGQRSLPTLLRCDRDRQPLWYLALEYRQDMAPNRWILLSFVKARAFDEAQRVDEEHRTAEDQRVADERSRKSRQEAAERAAAKREAWVREVAAFRANVKAGDRFRWQIDPPLGYAVGIVVRVEGDLIFVQFDNAVVGGSNTRYLKRGEIEPWDGLPTGTTYNIQ